MSMKPSYDVDAVNSKGSELYRIVSDIHSNYGFVAAMDVLVNLLASYGYQLRIPREEISKYVGLCYDRLGELNKPT